MPTAHGYSYDRGFDVGRNLGHAEVVRSPIIEKEMVSRSPRAIPWRKFVAMAIVGVMVSTGFVVLGETVLQSGPAPVEEPIPAEPLAGTREVNMTINHMFELYLKEQNSSKLGRWGQQMGLNGWWPLRQTKYQEWQVRGSYPDETGKYYPYVLCFNPYSTKTTATYSMGNQITTWYRQYTDATHITELATAVGKDPIFVPLLNATNGANMPGGSVSISWYGTYLETWEVAAIRAAAQTHYANTYYGVPKGVTPRYTTDDGYYHELQGKLTFDREACQKFLGMDATGDLQTEFGARETGIESAWLADWLSEGANEYDTYTAYDFSLAIQWFELLLDPDFVGTDPDHLHLRFWSMSWGNECLLVRYMEKANITKCWQNWNDDWYLNITLGPDEGSLQSRAVVGYHMTATKDGQNTLGAWSLEPAHMDWCGNAQGHTGYTSPYNAYDPDQYSTRSFVSWAPLTMRYGMPVSYAVAPMQWNLTADEKLVIQLPSASKSIIGYKPMRSTSDTLSSAKMSELANNSYWGELVMGNGYPDSGENNTKNFYDPVTKTVTIEGPVNFTTNTNPSWPMLLNGGVPSIVLDVAKVSSYDLVIGAGPPYNNLVGGTPYTLTVTARNGTGWEVTDYNGTTDLSCTDLAATIGEATHHWTPGSSSYQTTITFWTLGTWYVNAADRNYTQDVTGSITVTVTTVIPEFATLAVPVVGAASIMLILRARRKKRE